MHTARRTHWAYADYKHVKVRHGATKHIEDGTVSKVKKELTSLRNDVLGVSRTERPIDAATTATKKMAAWRIIAGFRLPVAPHVGVIGANDPKRVSSPPLGVMDFCRFDPHEYIFPQTSHIFWGGYRGTTLPLSTEASTQLQYRLIFRCPSLGATRENHAILKMISQRVSVRVMPLVPAQELAGDWGELLEPMIDWSSLGCDKAVTDSTVWLGTGGCHTPLHFDTYGVNLVRTCRHEAKRRSRRSIVRSADILTAPAVLMEPRFPARCVQAWIL